MSKSFQTYIFEAILDLTNHGFDINFVKDCEFAGFVDDIQKIFTVKVDKPLSDWGPIFVHEYCHFQQWKEGKYIGKFWDDTFEKFDQIVEGKQFFPKKETIVYTNRVKRVELDCERRVVHEAIKHNLPINIPQYIQQANSYIYSHNFVTEGEVEGYLVRTYSRPEIYSMMPSHFLSRYDRLPKKYKDFILSIARTEKK